MYNFADSCQFDGPTLNKIYEDAFGIDKKDGWFVEVGASNGQSFSNTCGLADIGWHGIYVEPVLELADACRVRHVNNNVEVFNCAAGSINGEQSLYMIPEWGTATSNHHAASTISKSPVAFTSQVFKLDFILRISLHFQFPIGFDLLVIDVDFGEPEVLAGFNINYWKPKLAIIELHEDSNHPLSEESRKAALPYFEKAGYQKIYHDSINSIFKAP